MGWRLAAHGGMQRGRPNLSRPAHLPPTFKTTMFEARCLENKESPAMLGALQNGRSEEQHGKRGQS